MDIGEITTATTILVGFVAVLIGILALMWQMHSQGGRLDAKIDAQGDRLNAQGDRLNAEIRAQGDRLDAEIRAQGGRLDAEIRAQGVRLNEAEREQARLEGVNSVLRIHSHTHEAADD